MKSLSVFIALILSMSMAFAQETVSVCFTASTESGNYYCPFTSVNVTNVTRGWSETLVYPDTLLILTNTNGIGEENDFTFHLRDAHPNPFSGATQTLLQLTEDNDVSISVIRADGQEVISNKLRLQAGVHQLTVSLSSPGMAFLVVTTKSGRKVAKLIQIGNGDKDFVVIDEVSNGVATIGKTDDARNIVFGDFEPGDVMRYEALLEVGDTIVRSEIVTQEQYHDETVTFRFPLERPFGDYGTYCSYVSITDVQVGAYLIDNSEKSDPMESKGHCWSTTPNPTINDNHATAYSQNYYYFHTYISGLQAGTKYYIRPYVTNLVGTVYGEQLEITTFIDGGEDVEGTIDGLFTVAEGRSVYFSNGNLMYNKTTEEWSFMTHQYDIVETSGQDVGFEYANQDSIGLFGWATSGWDNGNEFFQPYSTRYSCHIVSFSCCDQGYGYGPLVGLYTSFTPFVPPYAEADWGFYNPISNGGNTPGMWRALTGAEWYYLFNTRSTPSGIRYAKAIVNDVNGVIILPDDWDATTYALEYVNTSDADYTSNVFTVEGWAIMEANGAVFLPAAGIRWGSNGVNSPTISSVGSSGCYWSSSDEGQCYAKALLFGGSNLGLSEEYTRYYGMSVRLVRPYN